MFNEVNDEQQNKKKKKNQVVILFDNILDHGNPFKNIETDDIYIEDDLFDNNDSQDIKNISGDVIETIVLSGDIEIPSNNELATDAPEKTNITQHTQIGHV